MLQANRIRPARVIPTDAPVAWFCLGGLLVCGGWPLHLFLYATSGLVLGDPDPFGLFIAILQSPLLVLGHAIGAVFTYATFLARHEAWLPVRLTLSYWGFAAACIALRVLALAVRIVAES